MTGHELVLQTMAFIRRYVGGLTDGQAVTLALWTLHTWIYDRLSRTTPYVEITGVSGSGKTTLMECLSLLSRGSLILNTLRTLAMCRYISEHEGRVSMFIDEAERLASASFGDQRSMLASGYRRGGEHLVSSGKETMMFSVWCPKVFTSTRTLTTVIHNRCIPVWLERGRPEHSLSNQWEQAEAMSAVIIENYKAVMARTPRITTVAADWLTSERDQEIWTPLVSLATTLQVEPTLLKMLTAASVDLSALRGVERKMDAKDEDENAKERSFAVRLIGDVCTILESWNDRNIHTAYLIDQLRAMDTAPWRSYQRNGLTEVNLAQLLGALGVPSPDTVWIGTGRKNRKQAKGYKVADLKAACKQAGEAQG